MGRMETRVAQLTLDIVRGASYVAGHRTGGNKVATVTVEVLPLTPDAAAQLVAPANIGDEILYTQYRILTVDAWGEPLVPCPDIRMGPPGDLLVDNATPNTSAGTATTTYVVHGVNQWSTDGVAPYLDIHAQVQAQPSQTGG